MKNYTARVAEVNYTLAIAEEAIAQLRSPPKEQRRRIGERLTRLQRGLAGDVKKLSGKEDKYRLRVGDFRVLLIEQPADFGLCGKRQERSL